jgi:hypothetical protein
MITAICLTSFALSVDQGEVDEGELRNDWIRDSRSMLNHHWNSNPSLFRLTGTPDGDLVLIAGKRRIEIWQEQHCSKGAVEYVLHPQHTHHWECPFHVEPITQPLREDLIRIIILLLEAKVNLEATANKIDISLTVKVEW